MTPELWKRIEELYHHASALDADRRPGFLDGACGADRELRSEVESLLRRESKAVEFLESRLDTSLETSPRLRRLVLIACLYGSAPAEWETCTGRTTAHWAATSLSRCCGGHRLSPMAASAFPARGPFAGFL